jgi:hypothetical protein
MLGQIIKQTQKPVLTLQSFLYATCGLLLLAVMAVQLAACRLSSTVIPGY